MLPAEASAAAAVASLFFIFTAFSPLNFVLTGKGFHLYIPIGIATAFRGVAHAARASFFVGHNLDLMAVYGALNAAGFGIAVAMCCCFIVIWLRRAQHGQPRALEQLLSLTGRLMVACVIAFGPVLGVVAAIVVYSTQGDPSMQQHGQQIRLASSAGFTAVSALATLISLYLALSWALFSLAWLVRNADVLPPAAVTTAAADDAVDPDCSLEQRRQQQERQRQQPQGADGLVLLLAGCLLLLCWAAAARLAQYNHPAVASSTVLYYCVSVLPELIVAALFAAPTLAARVALGGQYSAWLRQQQERSSSSKGGAAPAADAEVGVDASRVQQLGK